MSDQASYPAKRRDVYSEITSQLIAAMEVDPGKPALPLAEVVRPLFIR